MMTSLVWVRNTLLAIHLLSAVIWVGGMFYAVVVLRPALNFLEAAPRLQMHIQTLNRFFRIVWHVMPMMLLSGWAMVFMAWGGFASLPWSINVMQTLGLLMALIFLYVFFSPWQRLRRAIRPGPELILRIRQLIIANLVLGGFTIIAGSLGHVW
ncbi:MAG TPA: CopD family protein [Acetobacteraceae bacterium]|nr:CopD family protein [Acetobacteraceae bacterium]